MAKRNADASGITTDHAFIRRWAEERGGRPAAVGKTREKGGGGIIRIDFPGFKGQGSLEPISWEEFFREFEERSLALVYQERTATGRVSRFNKLVSREATEEGQRKKAA